MALFSLKKTDRITIIYWLLLLYIMAALIWWYISLEKQNHQMADLKRKDLLTRITSETDPVFQNELAAIRSEESRNSTKYLSEGITFLILTLIGALFVYRSVRKQFKARQQQQNFMMAVTHELKTPISVAKLNLETLQKHNLDPEKQKKIIQMTLLETARLNSLTNNILVSSQLESGNYGLAKDDLDLSTLFHDCILEFRNRFPERQFIEEISPDMDITGDDLLIQLMINNLLDNAVKYTPREKKITCRLSRIKKSVVLNIIDEGPGIDDQEKENVFDKFYRTGSELTRKTQGTGLGLYLCRKIAEDHNADISVTNNSPSGSNFAVRFQR